MDKEYLQKFAINLKKLRKQKGMTQLQMETEYVSRSMISLVETARSDLTVSTVRAIAKSLGVAVKDLFDFED